jgi:hypothetical protein
MLKRFADLVLAHVEDREAYAAEIACVGGLTLEQARGLTYAEGCLRLSLEAAAFFGDERDGELARRFDALALRAEAAEDLGEQRYLDACRAIEDAVDELTRTWAAMSAPGGPAA